MQIYENRPENAEQGDCWLYYEGKKFVLRIYNDGRWPRITEASLKSLMFTTHKKIYIKKEDASEVKRAIRGFFNRNQNVKIRELWWHNTLFGEIVVL